MQHLHHSSTYDSQIFKLHLGIKRCVMHIMTGRSINKKRASMRKLLPAALAAVTCLSLPQWANGLSKTQLSDLPNFNEVTPTLFRGGQPTEKGLSKLKALGIKTIVSLRHNHGQV